MGYDALCMCVCVCGVRPLYRHLQPVTRPQEGRPQKGGCNRQADGTSTRPGGWWMLCQEAHHTEVLVVVGGLHVCVCVSVWVGVPACAQHTATYRRVVMVVA